MGTAQVIVHLRITHLHSIPLRYLPLDINLSILLAPLVVIQFTVNTLVQLQITKFMVGIGFLSKKLDLINPTALVD